MNIDQGRPNIIGNISEQNYEDLSEFKDCQDSDIPKTQNRHASLNHIKRISIKTMATMAKGKKSIYEAL
jgi:hypothetical protein